jgi:hypothetical protein
MVFFSDAIIGSLLQKKSTAGAMLMLSRIAPPIPQLSARICIRMAFARSRRDGIGGESRISSRRNPH